MKDKQAKYPQLRFKGFTDPWEQRKLEDISSVITKGTTPKDKSWRGEVNYVKTESIDSNSGNISVMANTSLEEHEGYLKRSQLQDGDVLFTIVGTLGRIGVVKNKDLPANTNQQIAIIRLNNANNRFVFHALKTSRIASFIKSDATIGAQPSLSLWQINGLKIPYPSLKEQDKIGGFFEHLDHLITLHQRKLAKLKELKQGYLQKLFPKNGSKFPQLRFAGFADAWEERKLSDVANHRGGTAIEKYFDKDGVYKVISIGSYGLNSQYVDQNIRAISNEITDGRVVNSGELTMVLNDKTANGTIIGRSLLVEKDNEYVINQRTEIISPKENFDSNFAYAILNGPFREKVKRIVQGGTQIYVNYPAVSNLNLELPKIEEQQKIGSFFKQLDETIALHQRKLEKLQELKKGYLQKMFC
ncbi:restriction endonuclease subunit S [Lactiplantibacillus plantarum]|uniref:restriction endonuclease subunit S n=1 Tax=Lactiplantibacillus plantarum TaxID=1590 RepID=UPI00241377FC|nr:restriction endonuclease subunit S [Lactiplantibacillus plantarum]